MSINKAHQRHDSTITAATIRLPKRFWAIVQAKQDELAAERSVPTVSRPVALQEILRFYEMNYEAESFAYEPCRLRESEEVAPL